MGPGDHNGAWGHNGATQPLGDLGITKGPGDHNGDHVPGTLFGFGVTMVPGDHHGSLGPQGGLETTMGTGTTMRLLWA